MDGREDILTYFKVEPWLVREMCKAEREARESGLFCRIEEISALNHYKVLRAFQEAGVSDFHFQDSTGYGYGDVGREVLERIFAIIFQGEEALVRPQIVSGTHALSLCLKALLHPGDTLLAACGRPYDTLATVIGINRPIRGSLVDCGVHYAEVQLTCEGQPDLETLAQQVERLKPRVCFIQRSRGYCHRPALSVNTIRQVIRVIKDAHPRTLCLVDNCYGELVEVEEPCAAGADLVAGSLIKNPGGTLVPSGGYIVGRKELVEEVSYYLTAPGLGREMGAFSGKRLFFQGLFLAPLAVEQALKGAVLASIFFQRLGYPVDPLPEEERHDIVQTITLGNEEALRAFCRGLQKASPVESYSVPEPAFLPGYEDAVIMAGGTFIQGASLELSADAPIRPPYTVFLQGGLSLPYTKIGLLLAAQEVTRL